MPVCVSGAVFLLIAAQGLGVKMTILASPLFAPSTTNENSPNRFTMQLPSLYPCCDVVCIETQVRQSFQAGRFIGRIEVVSPFPTVTESMTKQLRRLIHMNSR
jgi:hypothetical protein